MAIERLATSLNDDQKELFEEEFNVLWNEVFPSDTDKFDPDLNFWSDPWDRSDEVTLEGDTIKQMVKNYFDSIKNKVNGEEEEDDVTDWEARAKELFALYDEIIDSEGPVSAGGFTFDPSRVLKEMDPIAYKEGFDNYIDSELGENEINKIYETNTYDQNTK